MNIKLSLVTSTHNAYPHNFDELGKSLEQEGIDLEIIYVNDPYGNFHDNISKSGEIRRITPPNGLGYFNSMRFGLLQTTGTYVYFLSDDAKLNDISFHAKAIKELNSGADLVFSRSEISSEHGSYIMHHPFRQSYVPAEFLREWYNLRMIFVDYFSFSSFMFRKDMLMKAEAFISTFPYALSLDTATILKTILLSKSIAFVDCVSATRHNTGISRYNNDKSNMTDQVVNHFAIPLDVSEFIDKLHIGQDLHNELKVFFNQYAIYSFNAITSDFYQTSNQMIFDSMEFDSLLKGREVYIYGRGWVGLALFDYLKDSGIRTKSFIDDFKTDESILPFDKFSSMEHKNTSVIIASYKCSDVFKIYKKLIGLKDIEVIDLMRV